jgi:hypothetical protein
MGVYSGRFGVAHKNKPPGGTFEPISAVRNWTVSETSEPTRIVASHTKGGSQKVPGIKDWNGSAAAWGGNPVLLPGDLFTFKGYTAPDNGVFGGTGTILQGDAYVMQFILNLNWEGNESVNQSFDFNGSGALEFPAAEFLEDDTSPNIGSICELKIEQSTDGTTFTPIENIATATLTITNDVTEYVNSSTNCYNGRIPGPIDWTLSLNLHDNVRPIPIQENRIFKIWINKTDFWLLEWGHVDSYSDLSVNIETGEIISQTLNAQMSGFDESGGVGQIVLPDKTVWWPQAAATVVSTVQGVNNIPA